MNALIRSDRAVTLVGGGPVAAGEVAAALDLAPVLVAADGGAAAALEAGQMPLAVIGDFDSLDPATRAAIPAERLQHVAEQDSTDFHKCLSRIEAPLVLGLGFAGGRMDHMLAVFNVLVRLPRRRAVILGPEDLCLLAPPSLSIDLDPGTPVSLFPMAPVTADSRGLEWPVQGIGFAPDGQGGTSNRATGHVSLNAHAPKLLLMLPRAALPRLLDALPGAPGW
ncbi:thiamine diphosphokinase [Mangrovicoccus algicola]|uniref:Thiamine diphosphokinase n=1 Tax=Mangrovicoccus algicola TaxID=2771008 RepID=A0A8J7CXJ0_9RHOB|nr:thiamine diphosphokinase [Mangrovicoccus algicola]MBE3640469.1 thiamine diphosphokinase [Mangrovicoccus algicola]